MALASQLAAKPRTGTLPTKLARKFARKWLKRSEIGATLQGTVRARYYGCQIDRSAGALAGFTGAELRQQLAPWIGNGLVVRSRTEAQAVARNGIVDHAPSIELELCWQVIPACMVCNCP